MFNPEAPPELAVSRWFNTKEPITLAGLKSKVVVLTAFQMSTGCRKPSACGNDSVRRRWPSSACTLSLNTTRQ